MCPHEGNKQEARDYMYWHEVLLIRTWTWYAHVHKAQVHIVTDIAMHLFIINLFTLWFNYNIQKGETEISYLYSLVSKYNVLKDMHELSDCNK